MKPGACLLNFARQEIVDGDAVVAALEAGTLRRYITDFPAARADRSRRRHPHAPYRRLDRRGGGELRHDGGGPGARLPGARQYPQLGELPDHPAAEPAEGVRLAVSNENVPTMLGKLLSLLADENINIIDMLNKSRGDIAYNLIDVACMPSDDVLEKMRAVEGIINVRVIGEGELCAPCSYSAIGSVMADERLEASVSRLGTMAASAKTRQSAVASLAPGTVRRYRYRYPPRRQLEHEGEPIACQPGAAVRQHPAPRGRRRILPGDTGGEMAYPRRGPFPAGGRLRYRTAGTGRSRSW